MSIGMSFKEEIEKIFMEAREKYPHITDEMLDCNGAIHYMNGKNGTEWDWKVNNHLPYFIIFHKDEMGFIRVEVGKNDIVYVYIYEDGGVRPTYTYETTLESGSAKHLYRVMSLIADDEVLWNKPIDQLDWDIELGQ